MEVIFKNSAHWSLTAGVERNVDEQNFHLQPDSMKFMINWRLPEQLMFDVILDDLPSDKCPFNIYFQMIINITKSKDQSGEQAERYCSLKNKKDKVDF